MSYLTNIVSNQVDISLAEILTIKIYKRTGILTVKARKILEAKHFNPTNNYNIGYRNALLELGFIKKAWHHFLTDKYVVTDKKYIPSHRDEDILADLQISLPYDSKDLI